MGASGWYLEPPPPQSPKEPGGLESSGWGLPPQSVRFEIEKLKLEKRLAESEAARKVAESEAARKVAEIEAQRRFEIEQLKLEKRLAESEAQKNTALERLAHKLELKNANHRHQLHLRESEYRAEVERLKERLARVDQAEAKENGREEGEARDDEQEGMATGGEDQLQQDSKENGEENESGNEEAVALAEARRLKKFPWLRPPVQFGKLPEALLTHLFSFLPDEMLFECRGLCASTYFAFYNQHVKADGPTTTHHTFNYYRMIRLALKDRVFARVEHILYDPGLNENTLPPLKSEELQAISPRSFPNLRWLCLYDKALEKASLTNLCPIPKLELLGVQNQEENVDQISHVTPERYLSLDILNVYAPRLLEIPANPNIKEITLGDMATEGAWEWVTKTRFPGLEVVEVCKPQGNQEQLELLRTALELRADAEGWALRFNDTNDVE